MKYNLEFNDIHFIEAFKPENFSLNKYFARKKQPTRLIPLNIQKFGYLSAYLLHKRKYETLVKLCTFLDINPGNLNEFQSVDSFYMGICYHYLIAHNESFFTHPFLKSTFVSRYDNLFYSMTDSFSNYS